MFEYQLSENKPRQTSIGCSVVTRLSSTLRWPERKLNKALIICHDDSKQRLWKVLFWKVNYNLVSYVQMFRFKLTIFAFLSQLECWKVNVLLPEPSIAEALMECVWFKPCNMIHRHSRNICVWPDSSWLDVVVGSPARRVRSLTQH